MTDTWCCDTCRNLAEAANPLLNAVETAECICLDAPGDMWGCPEHPVATNEA